ncbi:hypothetical protein VTJ04DRAFT_4339 [Mycothermus thermophilus]|uniref:uncharacterized protein n=1 Tax=Humicola insolens TaxID=85995 RepID=UPI003743B34B
MDADGPYKQEFNIRTLPTRSVTLFPSRAQIIRDIKNVTLKPGPNEITVVGVTPTADEHSIKVEGTGSAIITDMTVELLPNREIFEEIYPDSDSEEEEDEEDDDDIKAQTEAAKELEAQINKLQEKLVALGDEQKRAKEIIASAESRLKILDSHGNALDRRENVNIEASIETYRTEREKVFKDHMDGVVQDRALAKSIAEVRKEIAELEKQKAKEDAKVAKAKAKAKRAKEKLREKQRRRDEEKKKEKERIRKEREQFWPRSVYSVRISLDAAPQYTPDSSRRTSIASAADVKLVAARDPADESQEAVTCDLTISYLTSSAYWTPNYDLALSTLHNTGNLSFDARIYNMTSETWTNSKVILSTSQANFSGLQDEVPTLIPWRLRLNGKAFGHWDGQDICYSNEESNYKIQWNAAQNAVAQTKPRAGLFGKGSASQQEIADYQTKRKARSTPQALAMSAQNVSFGAPSLPQGPPRGLFNKAASNNVGSNTVSLFGGGSSTLVERSRASAGVFGSAAVPAAEAAPALAEAYEENADEHTIFDEPLHEVGFQDSTFEETGLTATYDLPHLKTLRPSATPSKQRIAHVNFTNVTFLRTVVAKYKPAAYLRARLRNTSKLTILKGPVGLTLDGTFLGRSTLARCSAGDTFTVALGVDPAVRVAYPKPDVSRATTGVFSRDEHSVYTRSITLVNTRGGPTGRPVQVTVLDQVPVSEDEKLRVSLVQPAGLVVGGRPIAAGVAARDPRDDNTPVAGSSAVATTAAQGSSSGEEWGKAWASLKKAGEIQWDVTLNAGKSVKLVLQYEVAFPSGERVTQVS